MKKKLTLQELEHQNKEYTILLEKYKIINEQLQQSKKLIYEKEKLFNAIFNNNPNPTHLVDKDFNIILTNDKLLELKQLKQEDIKYKKCYEVYQGRTSVCEKCMVKHVFDGELMASYENQITTHDGNVRYFKTFAYPIFDDNGKIIYASETTIDITDKKQVEQKLQQQNQEYLALNEEYKTQNEKLIISQKKAEENDMLKTKFIHNMSHEIRTPMNGILGFANILNNKDVTNTQKERFIKIIQSSGKQLLQIIDDILEISRLETKQVKIYEEKVCLNDVLLELFSIFDIKAKEKKLSLYLERTLSEAQSTIITDKVKLNKILNNLLENAIKYTNDGFIEIGYKLIDNNIKIYVKDTGIGIAPKNQKIIFERFSQEDNNLSKKTKGLGLGLSIAKENAELLGGKLNVKSKKGKGSEFFINMPYKPTIKENKKNKTLVLLAEDEDINYLYYTELVESFENNIKLIHAKDGKEAVKICKENNEIKLVLMDLKMPIMDGFEATKLIKELRPDLPVIAQSAYTSNKDKEKALDSGCEDFLTKPVFEEDLQKIIDKYFVKKKEAVSKIVIQSEA